MRRRVVRGPDLGVRRPLRPSKTDDLPTAHTPVTPPWAFGAYRDFATTDADILSVAIWLQLVGERHANLQAGLRYAAETIRQMIQRRIDAERVWGRTTSSLNKENQELSMAVNQLRHTTRRGTGHHSD